MPAVSRHLVDKARTGHPCTSSIPVIASQFSVFANGSPILRPGDALIPHTILVPCKDGLCCKMHQAFVTMGSSSVFIQGVPVARQGDKADKGNCTSTSNVFAGG